MKENLASSLNHQTSWTLKRWAFTFLVIFVGLQIFRGLVHLMLIWFETPNIEFYITQGTLGWTLFAIGLVGALVLTPLIGRTVIKREKGNAKSNPVIQTEPPWFFSGEFPFKLFPVCLLGSIMLSMLTDPVCHVASHSESNPMTQYQFATCRAGFEGVKSLVFGFGTGTALWFIFWARRMEKITSAPIQLDFRKTKKSSIELRILATTFGLYILFKAFIYPMYIILVTAN